MARVNIIIKGIAMSYHKGDGLWRILFPFGDCHEIKFKEDQESSGISLAGENRQIQITTENASSVFEIGDNYKDFLDLTADYSHSNGVRMKNGGAQKSVLMSIENAKLSVYEYTKNEHMLINQDNVTFAPALIGYSALATIDSEKVFINVNGHADFPKVFEEDCTLIFDNDCGEGDTREISDFDLVYNVVEGVVAEEKRFVVTKVPENIDHPIIVGTYLGPEDKDRKDPFAGGLPCHMVTVSQPENLP
jgi:hypothetical protein